MDKTEITPAQIEQWKREHGKVFKASADGHTAYYRKPTRKDLSYISSLKDPIKMSELLLEQTWVAGDEVIKTNDELFMAVVSKMDEIIKVKEAEIKKL